jgi:hypothetical protein
MRSLFVPEEAVSIAIDDGAATVISHAAAARGPGVNGRRVNPARKDSL